MIEMYGWMTILGDEESNDLDVMNRAKALLENTAKDQVCLAAQNGTPFVMVAIHHNHKLKSVTELIDTFKVISAELPDSYGILYLLDDEDTAGNETRFQAFIYHHGDMTVSIDPFFSASDIGFNIGT